MKRVRAPKLQFDAIIFVWNVLESFAWRIWCWQYLLLFWRFCERHVLADSGSYLYDHSEWDEDSDCLNDTWLLNDSNNDISWKGSKDVKNCETIMNTEGIHMFNFSTNYGIDLGYPWIHFSICHNLLENLCQDLVNLLKYWKQWKY